MANKPTVTEFPSERVPFEDDLIAAFYAELEEALKPKRRDPNPTPAYGATGFESSVAGALLRIFSRATKLDQPHFPNELLP